jgi:hypothetical protein
MPERSRPAIVDYFRSHGLESDGYTWDALAEIVTEKERPELMDDTGSLPR